MSRFAPWDRVIVTRPDEDEDHGMVTEAGGPLLVVELDDGRVVMTTASNVRHEPEPTDRQIYGAGSD